MNIRRAAYILLIITAIHPPLISAESDNQSTHGRTLPEIREIDKRFLTQVIRRSIESALRQEEPYEAKYVPPQMPACECQLIVTLRQAGYVRGIGVSKPQRLIPACQEAAHLAAISASVNKVDIDSFLESMRIQVELLGPPVAYAEPVPWTTPGAVDRFVESGVDGVHITLDGEQRWFTPAEMISKSVSLEEAIRTLAKEVSLDPNALGRAKLAKFQTAHWWEVDDHGAVVTLHRGMVLLPEQAVSRAGLSDAIDRLIQYMRYRQRPDGRFAFAYDPATDTYDHGGGTAAQAGAAWALAMAGRMTNSEKTRESADRALDQLLQRIIELPETGASFVAGDNGKNSVGITAQTCLALTESSDIGKYQEKQKTLIKGLLWLQLPTGQQGAAFPPVQITDAGGRLAGQTLLALSAWYEQQPSSELLQAMNCALAFYSRFFKEKKSLAMVPWQVSAFSRMALLTKRRDFQTFAFELADAACALQLHDGNCHYREMWGAFSKEGALTAGSASAAYVSALADAALLARQVGDTQRLDRYTTACRLGTRFVMQLQFRSEECYYVRSLRDTVNGIRSTPSRTRISITSCQHALIALLKAQAFLFPEEQ